MLLQSGDGEADCWSSSRGGVIITSCGSIRHSGNRRARVDVVSFCCCAALLFPIVFEMERMRGADCTGNTKVVVRMVNVGL